jgi:hypothetical protein
MVAGLTLVTSLRAQNPEKPRFTQSSHAAAPPNKNLSASKMHSRSSATFLSLGLIHDECEDRLAHRF